MSNAIGSSTVPRRALWVRVCHWVLALSVGALAYSGFFEDPITWLTLGIGAAYLAAPAPARQPASEAAKAEPARAGDPIPSVP